MPTRRVFTTIVAVALCVVALGACGDAGTRPVQGDTPLPNSTIQPGVGDPG